MACQMKNVRLNSQITQKLKTLIKSSQIKFDLIWFDFDLKQLKNNINIDILHLF